MLTGVGATIAPGSQAWNGTWADLVNAPSRISRRATVTVVPPGGSASSSLSRYVPAAWPMTMKPASIASAPSAGDEERLQRRRPGRGVVVAVADQQERRHRRQLPEAVEDEEVVGEDEADHRPGEQHEQAEQSDVGGLGVAEVAPGVGDDEHADAGDEREHQDGEPVEAQVEVDAERRDPRHVARAHVAVDDTWRDGGQPDDGGRRRDGGEGEGERAAAAAASGRDAHSRPIPTTRWSSSRTITTHSWRTSCTVASGPCPREL